MAPVVMGAPELSTVDAGRDPGGVDAEDIRRFADGQTRFSHPHVHPPAGADRPRARMTIILAYDDQNGVWHLVPRDCQETGFQAPEATPGPKRPATAILGPRVSGEPGMT